MAENTGIKMPSGFGGIMRYDEEYSSRFMLSPAAVVGIIIGVIVLVFLLKIFFPLA